MSATRDLAEVLTSIELREMELLARGLVDSMLTEAELEELLAAALSSAPLPGVTVESAKRDLLAGGLIMEHSGGYRSRMAETVRLLTRLRQGFRHKPITTGKSLVMDYRLVHKRRSRPRAECSIDDVRREFPDATKLQVDVAGDLLHDVEERLRLQQAGKGPVLPLYRYQAESAVAVLSALARRRKHAVLISAGTGSGKSMAFYLPALMDLAETVAGDATAWTKTLALYPRRELLRDQFAEVFGWVDKIHAERRLSRPLRIGAWLGGVPSFSNEKVPDGWEAAGGRDGGGIFPWAKCPRCGEELVWTSQDRVKKRERLYCTGRRCEYVTPDGMLGLTREALCAQPPDIMFTTTESLNRQLADTASHPAFGLSGAKRLRSVLVDEIHTYEGLTGAQTGYLFRRLTHRVGSPIVWVGLSATLANPQAFASQLLDLSEAEVSPVSPTSTSLESSGAEYLLALRHDPTQRTSSLSLTIQTAMAVSRSLDPAPRRFGPRNVVSDELFGQKLFIFTDKLDVTNRLYWSILDAEGWFAPGKPRTKYKPLTLANLRSQQQEGAPAAVLEPAEDRDADGQWWWLSEQLGHELDVDQKRIDRISSQESGSVDSADIVVATASLEVGFSDSRVGAVIQHKAPGSAARFIQRKGRAGRRTHTRPWTVVTLSDWGRDRFAWQTYDQLLDPVLKDLHLPFRNRYVQRIQAVYATLDWLAIELASYDDVTSTWSDLAGPANQLHHSDHKIEQRLKRQRGAAHLLGQVLERRAKFDSWTDHIKEALRLDDSEFNALLVSPPRPLLLSVLPTMQRRLVAQWEGEVPPHGDAAVRYRHPVPEFAPSSLFADLVSTEVSLSVPRPDGRDGALEPREESLPVARIMREFLPGNATRHFGHTRGDRHWVPIEVAEGDDFAHVRFELSSAYDTMVAGVVPMSDGRRVPLHVPTRVRLSFVPEGVEDATSVTPDWQAYLEPVGVGHVLDFSGTALSGCVTNLTAHLHEQGDAVRVARFALGGSGRAIFSRGASSTVEVELLHGGEPVALGFEYETDGLAARLAEVPTGPLSIWERGDYAAELLDDVQRSVVGFTSFDAVRVTELLERVAVRVVIVDRLSVDQLLAWQPDAVHARLLDEMPDDEDSAVKEALTEALLRPGVLPAVHSAFRVLVGEEPGSVRGWRQRRLAASIGAALLEAAIRLVPETDPEDIQIDIDPDGSMLWITELSPGGNGHIGAIVREMRRNPVLFSDVVEGLALPGELERLGRATARAVSRLAADDEAKHLAADMIAAWRKGHAAVAGAFDRVVACLRADGVGVDQALTTALAARFVGPGCTADQLDAATAVLQWVENAEQLLLFRPRIANLLAGGAAAVAAALPPTKRSLTAEEQQRLLDLLTWPQGREAALHDLEARGLFGPLPATDRHLLGDFLPNRRTPVHLSDTDPEVYVDALAATRDVELVGSPEQRAAMRAAIIRSQVREIDTDGLFLYPIVNGLDLTVDEPSCNLHLEEGISWIE